MNNKKKNMFLGFLLLFCSVSFGATLKVPQQFRSIYEALLKAQPGDTVFVAKGIYYENIAMVDEVVIRGENQKTTVINGRRKGDAVVLGADKGIIENFTIRNGRIGVLCKATAPIIQNCIIIDNKGSGIMAIMGLPQISNNIMRNGWTGVFLQSVKAIDTQIENNVIIENGYNGVHCANATQVLIRNDIIMGNDEYGVYCDRSAKRTRIVFNNFFQNFLSGTSYFAIENKTNMHKLPMFKEGSASIASFNYYCKPVSPMLKAGENGIDIGLLSAQMRQTVSVDNDGDGIPDALDKCPNEPEDNDGFQDEDGCPDSDNDGDGIPDAHRQVPERARGQGRLPGRGRLPGSRQRRRRHPRRARTSAPTSPRPSTATRTRTAARTAASRWKSSSPWSSKGSTSGPAAPSFWTSLIPSLTRSTTRWKHIPKSRLRSADIQTTSGLRAQT